MTSLVANNNNPLDFLASVVANEHRNLIIMSNHCLQSKSKPLPIKTVQSQQKSMTTTTVKSVDSVITPSQYLMALFQKHCRSPKRQQPLRPTARDFVTPPDIYDMEVSRAVRTNDLQRVKFLLQQGKSLDACNRFGESLIHMACRRGNAEMVSFLIHEAVVRVDVRDDFGRTILHDACWTSQPNFDVVDILIKVVPPEYWVMQDKRGHLPFDYARKEHSDAWLKYLQGKEKELAVKFSYVV